jgi:DNA (cytosine-5)-methyltransferase 1
MIEGFEPARDLDSPFRLCLAIEKDRDACRTLRLRVMMRLLLRMGQGSAYRQALLSGNPESYLREQRPGESALADKLIWHAELGDSRDCPDHQLHERLRQAINGAERWILVGGPPCQAFSRAGKARRRGDAKYRIEDDPRVRLYRQYLKVLRTHKPAAFVLENVPDLLKTKLDGRTFARELLEDLAGNDIARWRLYSCCTGQIGPGSPHDDLLVNTDAVGLPQSRRRMILVGIREDLQGAVMPLETSTDRTPAGAVLQGIPRLRSGVSRGRDGDLAWREILGKAIGSEWLREAGNTHGSRLVHATRDAVSAAQDANFTRGAELISENSGAPAWNADWYGTESFGIVLNHHAKEHMPEDLHRYLFAACYGQVLGQSPKLVDFPPGLQPKHLNAATGKFPDRFRVQLLDRPATTVTSHLSQDGHYFIHPDPAQCRSLTVREAARLQTFPDDYLFAGNKVSQYIQVGNAVPPLLAQLVAARVLSALNA